MDIKIVLVAIGIIIAVVSLIKYVKESFEGEIKPHVYTWLVWSITQGTATAGMWLGGGGIVTIGYTIGAVLVFCVFCFCLIYGDRKFITLEDTIILVIALLAIAIGWQLNNPLLAVIVVTSADILGYTFTYKKIWEDPHSETVKTWVGFTLSSVFALLALDAYNLLTLTYIVPTTIANALVVTICLVRRKTIKAPE